MWMVTVVMVIRTVVGRDTRPAFAVRRFSLRGLVYGGYFMVLPREQFVVGISLFLHENSC